MSIRSWLRRWIAEGNDPALTVTGIKPPIGGAYDYSKARAASMRARGQSASGRPFAGKSGGNIQAFRAKASGK